MNKFLKDLANPDHLGCLTRKGGTEQTQKSEEIFMDQECKESTTYRCRIRCQLRHKAHKINKIYRDLHAKFLKEIDHMEYHTRSERKNKTESIQVRPATIGKPVEIFNPSRYHYVRSSC